MYICTFRYTNMYSKYVHIYIYIYIYICSNMTQPLIKTSKAFIYNTKHTKNTNLHFYIFTFPTFSKIHIFTD